ncbi:hypothetical protein MG296_14220 [Flavobacteriaceae bacterium TK19130]|nr:hypothetical protein [Thermobacterium salinum]
MTEHFEKILDEIADTLLDIQKLKSDIQFISDKESEYFAPVIEKSNFFHRVYWNSVKLLIIDLYKLINPDEDYSINRALNYALSNRKRIDWRREIDLERIIELKGIASEMTEAYLNKLKNLRNKFYAHNAKDKFKAKYNTKPTLEECWLMNEKAQIIFNVLNLHLRNQQFLISEFSKDPFEIIQVFRFKMIEEFILSKQESNLNELDYYHLRDLIRGR